MDNYLVKITNYLWSQSWQLAVLVVVAAAISWALKNRSAHVRYLLWLIVLAKCLVPPLMTVPIAILPQEESVEQLRPYPIAERHVTFMTADAEKSDSVMTYRTSPENDTSQPKANRRVMPAIHELAGATWIVGIVAFGCVAIARVLRSNLRLRQLRKPLPSRLQSNIKELLSGFKIKVDPKVWLLDDIGQPFVWGLLRGSIYLPTEYLKIDNVAHRRDILGHEVCHILRLDAAVNSLQVLAQAIFWFHPFVWWANQKTRIEREKCCDEMAVAYLGSRVKDYSTAIVKTLITEHRSKQPVPSLAVTGSVKDIEERIKTMLKPGKKFYKRPSLIAAVTILMIALFTVPTAFMLTARAATKTAPKDELAQPSKLTGRQEGKVLAFDDFDGKLKLDWEILHADLSHCSLSKKPGTLTITTQRGAFTRDQTDYRNLFLTDCPCAPGQDFQLTTCISSFKPVAKFNQAGLICWNDEDNFLNLVYAWTLGPGVVPEIEAQRVFTVWAEEQMFMWACFPADQQLQKIWLRMTKRGNQYTFSASVDGKSFVPLESPLVDRLGVLDGGVQWGDGTVKRVGLYANNASRFADLGAPEIDASFDFFEVKALTTGRPDTIEPTKSLTDAAAKGDLKQVKLLISKGVDINVKDDEGLTPLHHAIKEGHTELARFLIDQDADLNAKEKRWDYAPLHYAIWFENIDIVEVLVNKGVDVNYTPKRDYSPLINAIWCKDKYRYNMVRLLLDQGAKFNVKDQEGWTAFRYAAWDGHHDVIELFVAKRADISTFHMAACMGDLDRVKNFVEQGSDVDTKDELGWTPLFWASCMGRTEVAQFLITKGANVNLKNSQSTALHRAARAGAKDTVQLLIAQGADVKARGKRGRTPLHGVYSKEVADLLIREGADVNLRDWGHMTPLWLAANDGHIEIVRILIEHGADVTTHDHQGRTALMQAREGGHTGVVELLRQHGAKETLHGAVASGNIDAVKRLISQGADVNAKIQGGITPLLCASKLPIVELLVSWGAHINARSQGGRTLLHLACRNGHKDVVEFLIRKGADVNRRDLGGMTALWLAAGHGHVEIAEILIANGADVTAKDNRGRTPLDSATEWWAQWDEMVELLKKHGAKE